MRSVLFALVVAGLCGILYGLAPSGGAISVALPYLKATTALTSAQLSLLVGACMVGAVPGGFLAGLLADRFGRRKALLFAAAVFVAGVPVWGEEMSVDIEGEPRDTRRRHIDIGAFRAPVNGLLIFVR